MSRRKKRSAPAAAKREPARSGAASRPAASSGDGDRAPGLPAGVRRWLPWIILTGIVLALAVLRWRLVDIPMERDEGEYAYGGQLILDGLRLYESMYTLKLPGIHLFYALMMWLFGESLHGVHVSLVLVSAVNAVLVFLLGRRLFGPLAGLVAAATLGLLEYGQHVQGAQANAEHYALVPALGGLVVLVKALDEDRRRLLVIAGVLLGLAFITKQHAGVFALASGATVLAHGFWRRQWGATLVRAGLLILGGVLPYAAVCLWMAAIGVFDKFWFWTFTYARAYVSLMTPEKAWRNFRFYAFPLWWSASALWLLALVGLTALGWSGPGRRRWFFCAVLFVLSWVAVSMGFYFRPHYFVFLLPAVALLCGLAAQAVADLVSRWVDRSQATAAATGLVVVCIITSVAAQWDYLFVLSPEEVSRQTYKNEAFPEAVVVGQLLAEHTLPSDRVGLICSDPQMLFYADRRTVSGFVYMYPMQEGHRFRNQMQDWFMDDIESAQPEYLLVTYQSRLWMERFFTGQRVGAWYEEFSKQYGIIGLVTRTPEKLIDVDWRTVSRERVRNLTMADRFIMILKRFPSRPRRSAPAAQPPPMLQPPPGGS